ncbi:MAG: hypothetical protein QOE68_934, partial [Thermoanaerobaculia bacterium]|nr:hypothetical protein [Thermoanaerobaculia bacterium]
MGDATIDPFRRHALLVIAAFVLLSSVYAVRLPRSMDEFGTANIVLRLQHDTPYRDFCPPKTLLAYYTFLPTLSAIDDGWNAITAARLQMVLFTAVALLIAANALRKVATDRAVVMALILLATMTNYLERSFEVRSDGLSSLLGFASLVFLLRGRAFNSGLFAALAFLATQKGIYFVAAGEAAVFALLIRRRIIRTPLLFNAGVAAAIGAYVAIWSIAASPQEVLRCTFGNSNVTTAIRTVYDVRWQFWFQTLARNPIFYSLAAAGLVYLAIRFFRPDAQEAEALMAAYGSAFMACALWHKQTWPYFYVNVAPTLFCVIAFFVHGWLQSGKTRLLKPLVVAAVVISMFRLPSTLSHTAAQQEALSRAGEQLVSPGEKYLDGVGILYRRRQSSVEIMWLDKERSDSVATLAPRELAAILRDIDEGPTKLIIWNYRLAALPSALRDALLTRFLPVYGNLFYYAPVATAPQCSLAYEGTYKVVAVNGSPVFDGKALAKGSELQLTKGPHTVTGGAA